MLVLARKRFCDCASVCATFTTTCANAATLRRVRHGVEHVFLELRLHGTTCDHFFDRGAPAQHMEVVPRARANTKKNDSTRRQRKKQDTKLDLVN